MGYKTSKSRDSGLHGKVLLWMGGYRDGFCEKLLEASPMSNRISATGSKMDILLAKAEPISDGHDLFKKGREEKKPQTPGAIAARDRC